MIIFSSWTANLMFTLQLLSLQRLFVATALTTRAEQARPPYANMGDSALQQVQWLGKLVSTNEAAAFSQQSRQQQLLSTNRATRASDRGRRVEDVDGTGKSLYSTQKRISLGQEPDQRQVWTALENLEQDSKLFSRPDIV